MWRTFSLIYTVFSIKLPNAHEHRVMTALNVEIQSQRQMVALRQSEMAVHPSPG